MSKSKYDYIYDAIMLWKNKNRERLYYIYTFLNPELEVERLYDLMYDDIFSKIHNVSLSVIFRIIYDCF